MQCNRFATTRFVLYNLGMRDTAARGQQQVGERNVETDKHDDSRELTPERHDSKADHDQGVGGSEEGWGGAMVGDNKSNNQKAVAQNASTLR